MKFKTVMKKVLSVAVVGAMVFSLAACGSKEAASDESDSGSGSSDGVTLKFQQWWGAELPEGYLDDIVANYEKETGVEHNGSTGRIGENR